MTDYRFKFSIISAVYNAENYLEEAIQSILAQDIGFQESVELILVDDGSLILPVPYAISGKKNFLIISR